MRKRVLMAWMLLMWVATIPVAAQETRGTISGTVRDKDGVLPGATVKITNTGTNVSQPLVTNASGYFEAPLLIAGEYEVSVELPNLKSFRPAGIQLGAGQSVPLIITLESLVADLIPRNIQTGAIAIPTEAHLRGDSSDLLSGLRTFCEDL